MAFKAGPNVPDAGLKPCPDKPNCVSSLAKSRDHRVDPLPYCGNRYSAKKALVTIIAEAPRAQVVQDQALYLRAEFKSRWFGFVDDVEFIFDNEQKVIHVRSASRQGYYDFGVNRRRVDWLRTRLASADSSADN